MRLVGIVRTILLSGPEEVRFFGRIALYALSVGVAYWFLTYETAGTVLLIGFGLCALFASLVLGHGTRGVADRGAGPAAGASAAGGPDPERPLVDESGRLPAPGLSPLGMGFGLAMAALGIAFGPWLILAGLVLVGWAGWGWLRSAMAEHAAVAAEDAASARAVPAAGAARSGLADPAAPADPADLAAGNGLVDPVDPAAPDPGTAGGAGASGGHATEHP